MTAAEDAAPEYSGPSDAENGTTGAAGKAARRTGAGRKRAARKPDESPAEAAGAAEAGEPAPDAASAGGAGSGGPAQNAGGPSGAERPEPAGPAEHAEPAEPSEDAGVPEQTRPSVWEERAARSLAFLRRRVTGEYEVDEFGFDPDLNDTVLMGILRPLYEKYFRVETSGIENVPSEGGALLVGNHSGTVPVDALMTQVALLDDHPAGRHLRMLAADLVFTLPFVGEMSRKMGHTLACNPDAERLLRGGEIVGVWPEGFKGVGKPFSQRYRLQRFGRGGFVSAALRTGVPIVPVSIVGAEEIYPKIADVKPLARLLGLPYFPVTPTFPLLGPLGLVPLPTKWHIAFGEPIPTDKYDPGAADDPMLVFDLTDQIRETIQDTLYRLLLQRRSVFF